MTAQQYRLSLLLSSTIAVVGLGISNLPLLQYLLDHGAVSITARDKKEFDSLPDAVKKLKDQGVQFICGDAYLENLTEKTIFRSPGIRPDVPAFAAAAEQGSQITSEMQLFFDLCPATIIGITGSDGKTTTTTLTHLLLTEEAKAQEGAFRVYCGGNIGTPLLPLVDEMTERDFAVVELSSFQLQDMKSTPARAAVTNVTPNHLNWHTDYEEYKEAKRHILPASGLTVLNADNPVTAEMTKEVARPLLFSSTMPYSDLHARFGEGHYIYLQNGYIVYTHDGISEALLRTADILIPGRHNIENYMTAAALTYPYVRRRILQSVAANFTGVRHRLEHIRTVDGVRYYNSSIDSSPNRTRASLLALEQRPVIICGGAAKGITFEVLADALITHAKTVVLTGATAEQIEEELRKNPFFDEEELPVYRVPDFEGAVLKAAACAEAGDIVLLSPACTSFDAFKNFEERGDTFRAIIEAMPEERVKIYKRIH